MKTSDIKMTSMLKLEEQASEFVKSLTKWNAKQAFRNKMIEGNRETMLSAFKRADELRKVELLNRAFMF